MALTDNLIAFWKLGEASGNRADSAGSNTLTDNATVTQAAGIVGNAAQFTLANSEYLSIVDNADLSTGDIDFSVSCWVYLDTKAANMNPWGKWTGAGDQREYVLTYITASDRFEFAVSPDGTATSTTQPADSFGAVATATWIFVVCWHDATENTINIQVNNGLIDSTAHTTGVFDGTAEFDLGAIEGSFGFFDGRVDAVGVWKRVLTAEERGQLYSSGQGMEHNFPEHGPEGQVHATSMGVFV